MKKFMKSVVPVSALLLMLVGCAEDEEDVNVDVNEEEPALTDGEEDVNIIEEGDTNSESNTNSEGSSEGESDGTSDSNTEETPDSNTESGEGESNN